MQANESDGPLLTINTPIGLFQYTRLPFGISAPPAIWQKAMSQVLQGIPGVVYFIDDILVTGHTRQEHEANLRRVLDRIREYGLHLRKSKCLFFQKELEFLGHLISSSVFNEFMDYNGIVHRRVPPYHPSSNGLAKNMVKSFKQALRKAPKAVSMQTKISQFLASYRSAPHSVTARTPAEIILGRLPRTRLSLIHPSLPQRMSIAIEERVGHRAPRNFDKGQKVLLRDLHPYAPQKWRHAIILCKQGPLTNKVIVDSVV